MKNFIFTLILLVFVGVASAQTVIENPKYGISNTNYLTITKIELTQTETIISFTVKIPPHGWVSVHEKSFIQPVGDTTKLYLTKGEGIEIYKKISWDEGKDKISYRLFFPKLAASVNKIDFGEPIQNAWKIFNIEVKEQPYNSILPMQFLGNWFSEKNGEWNLSFYDSIAVYDNNVWKYKSVNSVNGITIITLKNNTQQKQLFAKSLNNGHSMVGLSENDLQTYTNSFQTQKLGDKNTFKTPILESGKVIYSGLIHGYTTRMDLKTGLIRFLNTLTNSMETHLIKIEANGSFITEFPLAYPQLISVSLPTGNKRIFFEPGKDLFELINSGITEHPSLYMGESAAVNFGLQATENISKDIISAIPEITKMNQKEYNQRVMILKKDELEKLIKIQNEQLICAKAVQIRKLDIEYRAAQNIISFNQNVNIATYYANRELKEDEQQPFIPRNFDISSLEIIKDTPINNEFAIISNEYFNLLMALKNTYFTLPQGPFPNWLSILSTQLEKEKAEITPEEKEMLEYSRLNLLELFDANKSKIFNTTYGAVVQKFIQRHNEKFSEIVNSCGKENLSSSLKLIFGNTTGLPSDINNLQSYLQKLNSPNAKLNEEDFKKIKSELNSDFVKEFVMAEYYKRKAEQEVKKTVGTAELKTEGDKLFDSLTNKFKGKVVFVDFWATWCSPCRQGIEKMKPLKYELAGKNIVFLYITNQSSPEKTYNEMKPSIIGEHVKVSEDQWNYLTQKFNIYGIPHYALVDKNGKIVNPDVMQMGNDELKKLLIEQLND